MKRLAKRMISILRPRAERVARRFGWRPVYERVHWFGARSPRQAARALCLRAMGLVVEPGQWALVIGADGPLRQALAKKLGDSRIPYRIVPTVAPQTNGNDRPAPACVLVADTDVARVTAAARDALADPVLAEIPFEYCTGLEPEARQFRQQDEYAGAGFLSPVLLAEQSPYEMYSRSLERFEQKCGLRDYLDLYQLLASIVERRVAGDVAEFGSYKGHSGWLIGTTLRALGSDKPLHLFDMFAAFPQESAGVDYFWSGTHEVQADEVRRKLSDLEAIQLHAGEFEQTVPTSGIERLALAYVDCDSYRAVSYIANELFERRLSRGGVMVFEDYGHPALLGCRVAVHEFFDSRTDCVKFFSQFSGLYVVVKL